MLAGNGYGALGPAVGVHSTSPMLYLNTHIGSFKRQLSLHPTPYTCDMTAETRAISLRAPSTFETEASASSGDPPVLDWMLGTWHVTHATLPMWKSKCNVRITYTSLPAEENSKSSSTRKSPSPGGTQSLRVDDLVEYQAPGKGKLSSVHGVSASDSSKPHVGHGWAFNWRGKGWLMIASSHWEILGFGDDTAEDGSTNSWIVTYFTKTLFTPAGIDVYSRNPKLSSQTLGSIKDALQRFEEPGLKKLAGEIFEVPTDENYVPGKHQQKDTRNT